VLLHTATIDADTLGRLIAAARRSRQTTRLQAEDAAAEDMKSFLNGPPHQARVDVTMEALIQIADAASGAADAAQATEPGWADGIRGDLHTAKVACDHVTANHNTYSKLKAC